MTMQALLDDLQRRFAIGEVRHSRPRQVFFKVAQDRAVNLIRELKERHGYSHLAFLTAIDYIEQGVFTLTYMVHNHRDQSDIGLHLDLPRDAAEMESIHTLWAQAATYQRELFEMFGIRFPGSPRMEEEFILEGWEDMPPMRREFDTMRFSEDNFGNLEGRSSEEPREHMHQNLYPLRGGDR
jgi:NADH-quinone oxidoreductase subunit C